jgi:hypothetical protein
LYIIGLVFFAFCYGYLLRDETGAINNLLIRARQFCSSAFILVRNAASPIRSDEIRQIPEIASDAAMIFNEKVTYSSAAGSSMYLRLGAIGKFSEYYHIIVGNSIYLRLSRLVGLLNVPPFGCH